MRQVISQFYYDRDAASASGRQMEEGFDPNLEAQQALGSVIWLKKHWFSLARQAVGLWGVSGRFVLLLGLSVLVLVATANLPW